MAKQGIRKRVTRSRAAANVAVARINKARTNTVEDRFVAVIFSGQRPHREDQSFDSWVGPKEVILPVAIEKARRYNESNANEFNSSLREKRYVVLLGRLEEVHEVIPPKPEPKIKVSKLVRLVRLIERPRSKPGLLVPSDYEGIAPVRSGYQVTGPDYDDTRFR